MPRMPGPPTPSYRVPPKCQREDYFVLAGSLLLLAERPFRADAFARGCGLVDRVFLELVPLLDEGGKPSWARAAPSPGFAVGPAKLRRYLAPFHRAGTPAAPRAARTSGTIALDTQTRQLLFELAALLREPLVDISS